MSKIRKKGSQKKSKTTDIKDQSYVNAQVSPPDVGMVIVYPDYVVGTGNEIPWIGKQKWELGHAGVLLIDYQTKKAMYYEFGRYASDHGNVRKKGPYSVKYADNGKPSRSSLLKILRTLSKVAGQGGEVFALYREIDDSYDLGIKYAEEQFSEYAHGRGKPYSWHSWHCGTFAVKTLSETGEWSVPQMGIPEIYKADVILSFESYVALEPGAEDLVTRWVDLID